MARAIQGGFTVQYEGLHELVADAKAIDKKLARLITKAGKEAVDGLAAKARGAVPHRSGRMAGSIRTSSTQRGAKLTFGGGGAPHAPVNEFGGSIPARGNKGGKLQRHRALLSEMGVKQTGKGKRSIQAAFVQATGYTAEKSRARRVARSGRIPFKDWNRSGYFIMPTLVREKPDIEEAYRKRLAEIKASFGR